VAAIVRVKVIELGSRDCTPEGSLDAGAGRGVIDAFRPHIDQTIGSAENLTVAVRQVGKRGNDPQVQWNAACFSVLRLSERDVAAPKVYVAPVKPQCLRLAPVEQEDHQWRRWSPVALMSLSFLMVIARGLW
jgi:hypothetical protein